MVIFSAPSGSGKSTIINHLLKKDFKLEFSISATTRPPRGNEKHGNEYYFYTPDEFRTKIANKEFVEYEEVYENRFYGTLRRELERIWEKGSNVVFDVDVVGGVNLKKIFGDKAKAIFIQPPSVSILKERLESRSTDSAEDIAKRVAKAEEEMRFAPEFDKIIVNDELKAALDEAEETLKEFLS